MMFDTDHELAAEPADLGKHLGTALFVSPHLHDAVIGCGDLLGSNPGSYVVTVFSGSPDNAREFGNSDRACGFDSTASPIATREEEDLLASFLLEANPVWLDFVASQYVAQPGMARIAEALQEQIGCHAVDTVVFPLGLVAADHRLISEVCLRLCAQAPDRRWIAYADALHGSAPGIAAARIEDLQRRGWSLRALRAPSSTGAKRHALECYASQLHDVAGPGSLPTDESYGSERYWQIARRG